MVVDDATKKEDEDEQLSISKKHTNRSDQLPIDFLINFGEKAHICSNPIARWHICQCSIDSVSFSPDGVYLATVGRDGYLRVYDYSKEQLICGGKSYYGALSCCAWSMDGKYILTGGEDDLVQV